jgi:hypothetical protein
MEIFLLVVIAILVLGCFGSYWVWRLTKGWPFALRLFPTSLAIALTITPSILIGHGIAIVPSVLVLIDSIISGSADEFWERFVVPVVVVAGTIYVLTSILAIFRYYASSENDNNPA